MAGIGDKLKKFANNPWVKYGAAGASLLGGNPAPAIGLGARALYNHATNHPVGLGNLPAPHPTIRNLGAFGAPTIAPAPVNTAGLGLPRMPNVGAPGSDFVAPPPAAPAAPSFGLAGLSRPVDTSSLGVTHPNIPDLTPDVAPPPDSGPVDTSSLGITHPNIPSLAGAAAPPPSGGLAALTPPAAAGTSSGLPGMFNDGAGGVTNSKDADENNKNGYWGAGAYNPGVSSFDALFGGRGGGGGGGPVRVNLGSLYDASA